MNTEGLATGRVMSRTVVRFLAVGICNTAIDLVLFWVLDAPLGIVLANFVSTSAGMTFSFLVNGRHTFGASRVTLRQAVPLRRLERRDDVGAPAAADPRGRTTSRRFR